MRDGIPLSLRTGLVRPTFRYGMSTRTPDPAFRPARADVSEPDTSQGVAAVPFLVDTERNPSYRDGVQSQGNASREVTGPALLSEALRQSRLSRWQEQR